MEFKVFALRENLGDGGVFSVLKEVVNIWRNLTAMWPRLLKSGRPSAPGLTFGRIISNIRLLSLIIRPVSVLLKQSLTVPIAHGETLFVRVRNSVFHENFIILIIHKVFFISWMRLLTVGKKREIKCSLTFWVTRISN